MQEKYKRATRKDVAKLAGVSETIVSYVVNKNRYVDAEKRAKVLAAIKELNYLPNAIAKSLRVQRSNHIAFLTDEINNEHFGSIMMEMERFACAKGYLISLCNIRNDDEFIFQIQARQFDGIVICSNNISDEVINRFIGTDIPIVILANRILELPFENASVIFIDLYSSAVAAMEQLIHSGRKNIIYAGMNSELYNLEHIYDLRLNAYRDTLLKSDLEVKSEYFINSIKPDEFDTLIYNVLKQHKEIDAIFCHDDRFAMAAISAIYRLGLSIPKDIALVSFDNSTFSKLSIPPLSSVEIQRAKIGQLAIELLYDAINEKTFKHITVGTEFILRESSLPKTTNKL